MSHLAARLVLPGFMLAGLLMAAGLAAQEQVKVFDTPGNHTFPVPSGVAEITVEVWGAGGRGGSVTQGTLGAGGGGGGAFAVATLQVTPDQELDFFVGAGSNSANPGGDSWFVSDTTVLAKGGGSVADNAVDGAVGGSGIDSLGDITQPGGNGANGGNGNNDDAGGGGSSAGTAAAGNNAGGSAGATAPAGGGDGGDGSTATFGDGISGGQPGGGGGGARGKGNDAGTGGRGGNGQIVVTYAPQPTQLIAEYRIDECEYRGQPNEVIDSGPNGLHGSIINDDVNSIRNGVINRAARLNDAGTDSAIIEIPDPNNLLDNTDQLTILGWINPATYSPINSNALGVLSKRVSPGSENAYGIFMGFDGSGCSSNKLCIDIDGTNRRFSSNSSIPLNEWTHFALVYAAGQARLYLNGNFDVARGGLSTSIQASSAPLRLGDLAFGGTRKPFQGNLDEFKFFGNALSEQRVAEIYANESAAIGWDGTSRPPVQCGLLFEARMEQESWDGTPGEVLDTSGNGRNATSTGGADTGNIDPAIDGNPGTCRYGEFDGNDDGVDEPNAGDYLNGLSAITVMAWVYNTDSPDGNNRGIFFTDSPVDKDHRLGIRYDTSGFNGGGDNVIKAGVQTTDCDDSEDCVQVETEPNVMVTDQWQHVAMTWQSGGDLRVYVDGTDVTGDGIGDEGQGTGGTLDAVNGLQLGQGGLGERWQGRIDEFHIFDGALSQSEIVEWKETTAPCEQAVPDHIRLLHPGSGLTCSPADITVKACANPDCSEPFNDPVAVTFLSPAGNWSDNPVSVNGQTDVSLQVTSPGTVTLDAASDPTATNPTLCFDGGAETCQLEIFDAGFVIDIPDHVSDTTAGGTVAAVEADVEDPEQCVPGFENEDKDVKLWSDYVNPNPDSHLGTAQVAINGNAIPVGSSGPSQTLSFDENGVAPIDVRYADVGRMQINARYDGTGQEAGLVMTGNERFVARPAAFQLTIPDPNNPGATGPDGDAFIAAGLDFEIEVDAINASGNITPNFGNESPPENVTLESSLVAPSGGVDPGLSPTTFSTFGTDCDGGTAAPGTSCGLFSWGEVGIISITPRLASGAYLGTIDVVGNELEPVGRFIPDRFELVGGSIEDRAQLDECSSDFTYLGERFDADFSLYARNADNNTTANYEGLFAFLDGSDLDLSGSDPSGTAGNPDVNAPAITWLMGVGDAGAQLVLPRSNLEGPYPNYEVITAPVDSDGVALGGNDDIGSTELRFGRLVIDNAIGSELGPLDLLWRGEYWNGDTWLVNEDDDCTTIDLADDVELTSSGGDTGVDGTTTVSLEPGSSTSIDSSCSVLTLGDAPPSCDPDPPDPDPVPGDGKGRFRFSTPNAPGWVELLLELNIDWHFLRDDLDDDDNFLENPSARASFGRFEGDENRILLQEITPGGN